MKGEWTTWATTTRSMTPTKEKFCFITGIQVEAVLSQRLTCIWEPGRRSAAANALGRLGGEEAIQTLSEASGYEGSEEFP